MSYFFFALLVFSVFFYFAFFRKIHFICQTQFSLLTFLLLPSTSPHPTPHPFLRIGSPMGGAKIMTGKSTGKADTR